MKGHARRKGPLWQGGELEGSAAKDVSRLPVRFEWSERERGSVFTPSKTRVSGDGGR